MIDPKLYTLLAVVNNKNYTRAAEELSFTQPAVTQHIKQIEKELHVKIFNCVDNELKPTQEGAIVIEFARRTIALYEKMKQNLIFEKNNLRHFVVGVTHTAESNAVAEVLGKYSLEHPGTNISIVSSTLKKLYDMLHNYEIDFAIVEGKINDDSINSLLLDTDSLVLVTSNNHPFANKTTVSINEIKHEPLILRRPSSGTRNLFVAHLNSQNISIDDFNVILEVDNIATIKDLVRRDIGVSILPRSVCLDELKKGKISALPIENLSMVRETNILYNKDFRHTEILNNIISIYNKIVKNYNQ